jgi:hypothetical protein
MVYLFKLYGMVVVSGLAIGALFFAVSAIGFYMHLAALSCLASAKSHWRIGLVGHHRNR